MADAADLVGEFEKLACVHVMPSLLCGVRTGDPMGTAMVALAGDLPTFPPTAQPAQIFARRGYGSTIARFAYDLMGGKAARVHAPEYSTGHVLCQLVKF